MILFRLFLFLAHQCDVVYQLCVLFLRYDDKTLTRENLGLFQFLRTFHYPAFTPDFGLNILHMVPSNSNPVLAFHNNKKKRCTGRKPISNSNENH